MIGWNVVPNVTMPENILFCLVVQSAPSSGTIILSHTGTLLSRWMGATNMSFVSLSITLNARNHLVLDGLDMFRAVRVSA